tara:strand:- start:7187 stop:7480 length:294 start_codon:yes stop_codon:yes gene_type:complete
MDVPEFNYQNHIVVPLAYFDKLLKAYYGSKKEETTVQYEGTSTEDHSTTLASTQLQSIIAGVGNYQPGGVAKRKRRNINGIPNLETAERQEEPSEDN